MKPSKTSRKALRKEKRKSKKIAKDVAYKKSHVSSIGRGNKPSSATQKDSKKITSLKKMIKNAKLDMKTSSIDKVNSKTKLMNDVSNSQTANGPAFKKNLDSRMSALKEFINKEVNVSSGFDHDEKPTKKNKVKKPVIVGKKVSKKPKNTIKDKEKLKALEKGIADDDREINEMYRQMHFNVKQKKSTTILRNIFGDDICDIFDVLESEPSEANLLAEQAPLVLPKEPKPSKKRQKKQVPLPENAIVIDTMKLFFEKDEIPVTNSNDTNENSEEEADATKLSTSALKCKSGNIDHQQQSKSSLAVSKKRKLHSSSLNSAPKKFIPMEYEFEGLDDNEIELPPKKMRKQLSKASIKVVEENPSPLQLKSIIKVSKKKSKKRDKRLSVSFNLSKNAVKIIPAVKKPSEFFLNLTDEEGSIPNGSVDDWDKLNALLGCMDDGEDGLDSMSDEEDEDDWDSMSDQEISSEEEGVYNHLEPDFTDGENDTESGEEGHANDENITAESNEDGDIDMEAEFTDSEDDEHCSVTSDSEVNSEDESSDTENVCSGMADGLSEDIYGRLRDKQGNIVESTVISSTAYISPECRKKDPQLQEQLNGDAIKRVRTQLRGRLNRLAEVNLAGTVTMVSGLYKEHPRQLLNVVLAELLLSELAGEMLTLDRHCQECAVLLVAVAANVAEEVGAHILTDFVMSWHSEHQKEKSNSSRLRNLIMFVSHLYSFGLMHSVLVFDMLRLLVTDLTGSNVDQLVQVVGSVGFLLRKDDPEALRGVILSVQQHCAESASSTTGPPPQLELLSQMLRAVKNNNESKMPHYDPTYTEHLRKLLRAFVGGDISKNSPVRVTLEDLLLSETRGRWWVVGSAWTGGSLLRETTPATATKGGASYTDRKTAKATSQDATKFSASFMKLAENMRITRPPKINILFALTIGSLDTNEAILKLSQLSLTPAQEKLIFDVMLFCVQKLRLYKPFYGLLAMELCNQDNKYKRMLQHSLWDKFSDLDALKMRELKNLAKFVVDIVKQDTLNLSVLKTLPFADANKKVVSFLEDIFCQLFEAREGCHVSRDAFKQLFKSKKLQPLRTQFKIFLQVFIAPKFENEEVLTKNPLFYQRLHSAIDILSSDQGALL